MLFRAIQFLAILLYSFTSQIEFFYIAAIMIAITAIAYYLLTYKLVAGLTVSELDGESHPSETLASMAILWTTFLIGYFSLDVEYMLIALPMLLGMSYTTMLSILVYYDFIQLVDKGEDD